MILFPKRGILKAIPHNSRLTPCVPLGGHKARQPAKLARSFGCKPRAARIWRSPFSLALKCGPTRQNPKLRRLRCTICVAKMLENTQSILCAFCLAAGTPRSPYRHVELCGVAQKSRPLWAAPHVQKNTPHSRLRPIKTYRTAGGCPAGAFTLPSSACLRRGAGGLRSGPRPVLPKFD